MKDNNLTDQDLRYLIMLMNYPDGEFTCGRSPVYYTNMINNKVIVLKHRDDKKKMPYVTITDLGKEIVKAVYEL